MALNEENPRERKYSFGNPVERDRKNSFGNPVERERKHSFDGPPGRMRTRSFGKNSGLDIHIVREYAGDEMDKQLSLRQLVKKAIARDNTSIFRAVCEQISSVQTDHQDLRILVEQILRPITQQFVKNNPGVTYDRDKDILEILCDITNSRIKVYRTLSEEPTVYEGTVVEENREVQVCETQFRAVYAPVYSMAMHEALGISQAIVYRTLYEDVFKLPKKMIDDSISFIRDDIDKHCHSKLADMWMMDDRHMHALNVPCSHKQPLFPFCACKSLDPSIYRNVEYDLYRKKAKQPEQAAQNSVMVKFGVGARCIVRDGRDTKPATVVAVVKQDVRKVAFEDGSNIVRDYDVSDLRPMPAAPVAYNSMQALMSGMRGGPPPPMLPYLPGCGPPLPPNFLPPPMFNMPPASTIAMMMGGPPPPSPYYSSPSPIFPPPGQQHFSYGSNEMMSMPPPTPVEGQRSYGYSPAPADSSHDSSVFSATPVSSKKGHDGRRGKDKKPRTLSLELTDSPTSGRSKDGGLTWWQDPSKRRQTDEGEKRRGGGRRATEGDMVGEMQNRPLQPKQHQQLLSTCSNVPENDSPSLPSLMDAPTQQMQQMQLHYGPPVSQSATAAARAKLPSLFPLPPDQARPSYYSSSGELSDGVFQSADEGLTNSQMSLSNNHDSPLISSSSAPAPSMGAMAAHAMPCIARIPYVTLDQYNTAVNTTADYSVDPDGKDLPDTTTTRCFYNMGLQYYNDLCHRVTFDEEICPPSPNALPMPATIFSPMIPPQSQMMFFPPTSGPYAPTPSAPPPTPCMSMLPSMPPHLMQYVFPQVEGMPVYGFDPRGGMQMMGQAPMNSVLSPSPMMPNGQGNVFFN